MSSITNKAAILDDEKANILRGAVGTRACWMALIYEEACKAGMGEEGEEIIRRAVRRYGQNQGADIKKALDDGNGSLDMGKFAQAFGSPVAVNAFEAEVTPEGEAKVEIEYHFCPLLKSWQDLGCDDETCMKLCDMAMEGDRNMAKGMGLGFELTDTIANGCPTCRMSFYKE